MFIDDVIFLKKGKTAGRIDLLYPISGANIWIMIILLTETKYSLPHIIKYACIKPPERLLQHRVTVMQLQKISS